jgi:hypothetical protein
VTPHASFRLKPEATRLYSAIITRHEPHVPWLREDGRSVPVTTPTSWMRQRRALRGQIEQWIFGRIPPPPGNLRATVTATTHEGRATIRHVRLEFGPGQRATLRIELVKRGPAACRLDRRMAGLRRL